MKCQRNASPYSACFASRSCARFSPTTRTPASCSAAISESVTYFVAATTVTLGPTCSCTRASRSRISSGDGTDDSLDAARKAVAPVREEEVRVVAGAEVDAVDPFDARLAERPLGRAPEVELAVDSEVVVEEPGHLRPDLVAARPDRGSHDRRKPLSRVAAKGVAAGGDPSLGEPTPARMKDGERARGVGARDRDREAVGGHREHRQAWLLRPQAVPGLSARGPMRPVHGRRVHLPVECEPLVRKTEVLTRAPAVLLDLACLVAGAACQVERRVDAVAHAAHAGCEGDDVAGLVPDDHFNASARASRCSRVLRHGSRTTSSSSVRSVRPSAGPGW